LGPPSFQHLSSPRQGASRPYRARRCLLKGCERWFTPTYAQSRYCSGACREAARRWRRAQASRRYRASPSGRERRRAQQQRYRQRRREERAAATAAADASAVREGQRPASPGEDFVECLCRRPGCYVTFWMNPTRSNQRFCSLACRLALRRVLDREARYRQRRQHWRGERRTRHRPRPDTS
jgi:hypothetical protein